MSRAIAESAGALERDEAVQSAADHTDRVDRRLALQLPAAEDRGDHLQQAPGGRSDRLVGLDTGREGRVITPWVGEPVGAVGVAGRTERALAGAPRGGCRDRLGELLQTAQRDHLHQRRTTVDVVGESDGARTPRRRARRAKVT